MFLPCSTGISGRDSQAGTLTNDAAAMFSGRVSKITSITVSDEDPLASPFAKPQDDFSHNMHKTCLKQWFETRAECPVCRTEIEIDLLYNGGNI